MAKKAKGTVVSDKWRPLPKTVAFCMDELDMSQGDIEEQIKSCVNWQQQGGYQYADHDAVFRNHCDRWRKKNPVRKESSEPLQSYVPVQRRICPSESNPLPQGSIFKINRMRMTEQQRAKTDQWRKKALTKLDELIDERKAQGGTFTCEEAMEWMQRQMLRCSKEMG